MDINNIEKLMKLMKKHNIHKLKLHTSESDIKLEQREKVSTPSLPLSIPSSIPSQPITNMICEKEVPVLVEKNEQINSAESQICSPFIGTFYAAPSPDEKDFVQIGSFVKKGDTLCIVEAMKLMNEIESEYEGTVKKILLKNEDAVEYGQALFIIEKA